MSKPITSNGNNIFSLASVSIPEKVYFDEKSMPRSDELLSLLRPDSIALLLQYYQALKEET
jgi:hypothetical protein